MASLCSQFLGSDGHAARGSAVNSANLAVGFWNHNDWVSQIYLRGLLEPIYMKIRQLRKLSFCKSLRIFAR